MTEPLDVPPPPNQGKSREARHADQDRTLTAMLAVGGRPRGRQHRAGNRHGTRACWPAWAALDDATNDESTNANNPDSLLSDIKRTQPRLRTRVRGLRAQYQQLRQAITSIHADDSTDPSSEGTDYADLRQRLSWMLTALRHQRSRESDLLYEAYYDAFESELGTQRNL